MNATDPRDRYTLWRFNLSTPYAAPVSLEQLIAARLLAPAADAMPDRDITHQFNDTNGGEMWLTVADGPAPWIARRTIPNPDGTDPRLWHFYCADELDAAMWVAAGQAETIEQATA